MELEIQSSVCLESSAHKTNPLEVLFEQEQITFLELMSLPDADKHLKEEVPSGFSQKLLNHPALIKDVIDCALRPDRLNIQQMNIQWPFLASQFLTHQQQLFAKSFFSSSKSQQTHSDSGSRIESSQLLQWIFKILEQQKPINPTSAGYLLKMFTKIYYQNQQEFYWYFVNNSEALASCIQHFYNPSVAQLIWRIIDTYNQDTQNKVLMINKIMQGTMIDGPFVNQNLQNIQIFLENMIQRSQQMNTKKLSTQLCIQTFTSNNVDLIRKLISSSRDLNRNILKNCTFVLNTYLKFFVQQKNPKNEIFRMSSSLNIVTIPQQLLNNIILLVRHLFHIWFKNYPKEIQYQSKYIPIVSLHSVLKLEANAAEQLIFSRFIDLCILLFKNQPKNNILHNQIKGILGIAFTTEIADRLVTQNLLRFIVESFNLQSHPQYLNQLFYITKMIQDHGLLQTLKSSQQSFQFWSQYVDGKYKNKKQMYDTILGKESSPKKDFFAWQSEVRSEQGEDNGQTIVIKKYSEEDQSYQVFQKLKVSGLISPPPQFQQIEMNIPDNLQDNDSVKNSIDLVKSIQSIELIEGKESSEIQQA